MMNSVKMSKMLPAAFIQMHRILCTKRMSTELTAFCRFNAKYLCAYYYDCCYLFVCACDGHDDDGDDDTDDDDWSVGGCYYLIHKTVNNFITKPFKHKYNNTQTHTLFLYIFIFYSVSYNCSLSLL